jgi:hypothetical protein
VLLTTFCGKEAEAGICKRVTPPILTVTPSVPSFIMLNIAPRCVADWYGAQPISLLATGSPDASNHKYSALGTGTVFRFGNENMEE